MGKWKYDKVINVPGAFVVREDMDMAVSDGTEIQCSTIVAAHNADCDAYEAELARVKAESLRVVKCAEPCDIMDAKCQYVTDQDGELWECHPEPADDGCEVRSILTGCGGFFADTVVQPVRLERWEAES